MPRVPPRFSNLFQFFETAHAESTKMVDEGRLSPAVHASNETAKKFMESFGVFPAPRDLILNQALALGGAMVFQNNRRIPRSSITALNTARAQEASLRQIASGSGQLPSNNSSAW